MLHNPSIRPAFAPTFLFPAAFCLAIAGGLPAFESRLQADVIDEADLGTIGPGEQLAGLLSPRQPQGTLHIHLSEDDGPFYLLIQGNSDGAAPDAEPDLGLYIGDRSLDQDLEGDYSREGALLHGGRDYVVRVFQLNQSPVSMKLRVDLQAVEARELALDSSQAGLLSSKQPQAFYYFDHREGEATQLDARSSDTNLVLVLLSPDGRILVRDEVDQGDDRDERIVLEKLPAGRYYLEVRRRMAGTENREESTFQVAHRLEQEHGAEQEDPESVAERGGPQPLRSIAHLPVVPGADFIPGRKIQARLDRENPRMFHRVTVEDGRPLLIDVHGESGDLMLIVKGPFEYRADFDTGKVQGRELVVLPFAGEYQIIVQPGLENDERTIPYTVRTTVLTARPLNRDRPANHAIRVTEAGLYHFEVGYNFPVHVDVRGAPPVDLFLTVYLRKSDGTIEVRNSDSDQNGQTAHESIRIDESGEVYVVVRRQGGGRLQNVTYEIQMTENPILSRP